MAATAALVLAAGMPIPKARLRALKCRQPITRFERLFQNQLRRFRRDLFDLHPTRGRSHENRLANGAVEHDAEIEFALDRQRLFHQQALHDAAFGAGLVRHQPHAQNLLGDFRGFIGVFRDLHPTAFATSAGMNLRFDNDASADLFRGGFGLVDRKRYFAPWHRDIVLGQDRLGLILVNFHGIKSVSVARRGTVLAT